MKKLEDGQISQWLKLYLLETLQEVEKSKFVDASTKLEKLNEHSKNGNFGLGGPNANVHNCKLHYVQ